MTVRMGQMRRRSLALLALVFLAGCSGVRAYSNTLPPNFHVRTQADSGSALKSTVAEFDIHRVNAGCETEYLGRVYLDDPLIEVGIPVGETIYLDFIFASKAVLSTNIGATRYSTLLTPRSGYEYDVQVRYVQGIYSVAIRETRRGSSTGRIIEHRPLSSCTMRRRS